MIITNWGDDFACSVASPQLPGIVAAYDEHPDAMELFTLAVDAGLSPDGSIDVHVQQAMEFAGKQFFVRARHDHRQDERGKLAAQIGQELAHDPGLQAYVDADRFDDAVVVATLPSDRIHDVMEGADDNAPLTIGMRTADGSVHYIGMLSVTSDSRGRRLSDLGLDASSTIGAVFASLGTDPSTSQHQHGRILVVA
ncbi:hypothetical protein GU243_21815 [Pseudarthrobacter psychrotolerans]|uniref:Uncharacterized protein n=1 Tax=Pseudarthrobacter psychrotolerans TaxID=2697569 RepID=A0A6P1NMI1_9MICC|nr:hypothetical protein [Pseudarthrobacter psychrotolerans]QHK21865.1 hypothetical protein GU243_21815 [Pseudarthrobacter psychrotolerans]